MIGTLDIKGRLKKVIKNKIDSEKTYLKFQLNMELEALYFSIPKKRELIEAAAMLTIELIINKLIKKQMSKNTLKYYLRNDPLSKAILQYSSDQINNDYVSDMLLQCYNETNEIKEEIDAWDENLGEEDLLKRIDAINDIDKKVQNLEIAKGLLMGVTSYLINKEYTKLDISARVEKIKFLQKQLISETSESVKQQINAQIEEIKSEIEILNDRISQTIEDIKQQIKSFIAILQYIIEMIKDLFANTDHPSKYRLKYIQRVIRVTYSIIRNQSLHIHDEYKQLYQDILNALKSLDNILILIAMFTSIYLKNRLKLAKKSRQTLNEQIAPNYICSRPPEPFDVSINRIPLQITLECPRELDDIQVPHIPLSEKIKNLGCPTEGSMPTIEQPKIIPEIATYAIIQNNRSKEKFVLAAKKDDYVTQGTVFSYLGNMPIHSPVEGYIEDVSANKIILRDISEPVDLLSDKINSLNEKYQELNDIKLFLKTHMVNSLYPSMLSIAIVDNKTTKNVNRGVDDEWKDIVKEYEKIQKEYDKNIKNVTGKNNVEKHAKNETLLTLKDQIENEEKKFNSSLKRLYNKSQNISKYTKAQKKEYKLFEYYLIDLGLELNQIENPSNLESKFRDKINEFRDRRYIVDNYNKNKIEDKIKDLIKKIEKGTTNAKRWLNRINEIYNTTKDISRVKDYLKGLADQNNKLDPIEKTSYVNKAVALYEYYVNVDKVVQKYNVLKKETTSKNETIKEGDWITIFLRDLINRYDELNKEIEEIQDIIESLSLISTYSLTTYNDKSARLYIIADDPSCDPIYKDYVNPEPKFGYGDIQYWLKYCAFATLTSVANPVTGWSTGWILPTPILFPVIYIPIKPIQTKYGFIVLGLTVCGIYVFPMVIMANLSNNFVLPFADPLGAVKREIEEIKRQLAKSNEELKKLGIKPLLEKSKQRIEGHKENIENYRKSILKNKENKPKRYFSPEDKEFNLSNIRTGVQQNMHYVEEMTQWTTRFAEYEELLIAEQVKLWKEQTIYQGLYKAYTLGTPLKGISDELYKTQEFINSQLDKLSGLLDSANQALAALPVSITPMTANFGFTLKNPKPIIDIDDELDDNVNETILNPIIEKIRLSNTLTMAKNLEQKLNSLPINIFDFNAYLNTIVPLMSLPVGGIIQKDAFPHYNLLKVTNFAWLKFLVKFTSVGAKTYGFPGQLPLPIG